MNIKVTFISNFLNHHQVALCNALSAVLDSDFKFISLMPIPEEQATLGWTCCAVDSYEVRAYSCSESMAEARQCLLASDVIVAGAAPESFIQECVDRKKLIFRYYERVFKKGYLRSVPPVLLPRLIARYFGSRFRNDYFLCASAYAASDYALLGADPIRCFKWGYFPETGDLLSPAKSKLPVVQLLWAGRFLELKHPEIAIQAVQKLTAQGVEVRLSMIGTGCMEKELRELVAQLGLHQQVEFLGAMPPTDVWKHMRKSDIFLFTSDFNEGWGAVVNEAMSCGCAVVASHAAGSVPFLITSGENGFIYRNGDVDSLHAKIGLLAKNSVLRQQLGRNAQDTIRTLWNAEVAAERLLAFSDDLLSSRNPSKRYSSGPCSPAKIIRNNWFKEDEVYGL